LLRELVEYLKRGTEMLKKIIIVFALFLALVLLRCSMDRGSETFKLEKDTPVWLEEKINTISNFTGHYYDWTRVYRYEWNNSFIYLFSVPASSCMYCELYDQDGNKVTAFNDSLLQDILQTRKGEVLIWENKK
jgi:hypothetical protein